jgi:hypothetical protein
MKPWTAGGMRGSAQRWGKKQRTKHNVKGYPDRHSVVQVGVKMFAPEYQRHADERAVLAKVHLCRRVWMGYDGGTLFSGILISGMGSSSRINKTSNARITQY